MIPADRKQDNDRGAMKEMEEFKLTTPVAFLIFNRPDTTKEVFARIREAKPEKLYLICDAPREGREDDAAKVEETRQYVETHID